MECLTSGMESVVQIIIKNFDRGWNPVYQKYVLF